MARRPPVDQLKSLAREIIAVGGGDSTATLTAALCDAWSLGANGKEWRDICPPPPAPPKEAPRCVPCDEGIGTGVPHTCQRQAPKEAPRCPASMNCDCGGAIHVWNPGAPPKEAPPCDSTDHLHICGVAGTCHQAPKEAPWCAECGACNGTGRGVTVKVACPACGGTGRAGRTP